MMIMLNLVNTLEKEIVLDRKMGEDNITMIMETRMTEHGKEIKSMDMEFIHFLMGESMLTSDNSFIRSSFIEPIGLTNEISGSTRSEKSN